MTSIAFHYEMPILISGSEDGTYKIWNIDNFQLESTRSAGMMCVWSLGTVEGKNVVAIGSDEGTQVLSFGSDYPIVAFKYILKKQ